MPLTLDRRHELLRLLDEEHLRQNKEHRKLSPRNGEIPVGGAHMESFFRMEGVGGIIQALRDGQGILEAVAHGKAIASFAVRLWNGRREWQVHRWEKTCDDYFDRLMVRIRSKK